MDVDWCLSCERKLVRLPFPSPPVPAHNSHRMTCPVHTAPRSVSPTPSPPHSPASIPSPSLNPEPTASASGRRQYPLISRLAHPPSPLPTSLSPPPLHPHPSVHVRPAHVTSRPQSLSSARPHPFPSPPFASRPLHMSGPPILRELRPTPIRDQRPA